jgi:hypothetical protein
MAVFYFAWVDPSDTVFLPSFKRTDEDIVSFTVQHAEGGHPMLEIDIRNPRVGLLSPGRKVWAWLAWDNPDAPSAGTDPLFFGRLVGVPTELRENIVRLSFVGRPSNFDAQKRTLAESMRIDPFYDPVWVRPELREDPDVVLEGYDKAWHTNRITHSVTASSIVAGEDGTVSFGESDVIAESVEVSFGEPPVRRVVVDAEALWLQQAQGTVDVTKEIVAAFRAQGTAEPNMVSSYTGQGLGDDWPEPDADIGGGWKVGSEATLTPADGTIVKRSSKAVTVKYDTVPETGIDSTTAVPFKIRIPLFRFLPFFPVSYEAQRNRSEKVIFTLEAGTQALLLDESETEELTLSFSSSDITEPVDGVGSNATIPLGDLAARQFFTTDRGQRALRYFIAVARARLLARARAVDIEFGCSFARASDLSCRLSATITDSRLPGGQATGKIVAYSFGCNGDTGEMLGSVKISCMIGRGEVISELAGNPTYVDDDYVEDDYQQREGEMIFAVDNEITYQPLTDLPHDDGVDFHNMTPATIIESVTVTNGVAVQRERLEGSFIDIAAAVEALNAVHTQVSLVLVPVTGGPFEQDYFLQVSNLSVPVGIDLEAAA